MGKEKTKCYALRKVLFSGKKPNEFIKGESLELSNKEFKKSEANGLVGEKRPPLTEYECIQIEKKTGEKVKPTVKKT